MAVSNLVGAIKVFPNGEPPKTRTRKADRDFACPSLKVEVRPSRFHLAEKLYEHFNRLYNDMPYKEAFDEWVAGETERKVAKYRAKRAKGKKYDKPALRVSASKTKECARLLALKMLGFPQQPIGEDSKWWSVAAMTGTTMHEQIELALKWLKVSKRSEWYIITEKKDFAGFADIELDPAAFPELGADALPTILDVKTVGDRDYKEGTWGQKVPGYIDQVSAYAYLEGKPLAVVLLVNRSDGRMMDFEWDVDPAQAQAVLDRASSIVEQSKARKLPAAEGLDDRGRPSFPCLNFCPFAALCARQEQDGSVQKALDEGKDPKDV